MSIIRLGTLAPLVWTLACRGAGDNPAALGELQGAALQGVVERGPITPVCMVGRPCDAPFSALFHVYRAGAEIARFQSDSAGRFAVALAPGTYTVVPDSSAPLFPRSQPRVVTVLAHGTTVVTLTFDTGLR